ncbi:MAG: hypothetical protein KDK71_07280 [Chlamydiia bacterium]|nr:hypothetical protein [Chlamydiia bacterium]
MDINIDSNSNDSFVENVLAGAKKSCIEYEKSWGYTFDCFLFGESRAFVEVITFTLERESESKIHTHKWEFPVQQKYSKDKLIEIIRDQILFYSYLDDLKNRPLTSCLIEMEVYRSGWFFSTTTHQILVSSPNNPSA